MVSAPFDLREAVEFLEHEQWFPYAFLNTESLIGDYTKSGATSRIAADLPDGAEELNAIQKKLDKRNICSRGPYASMWHDRVTRKYTGHDTVEKYYGSMVDMVETALPKIKKPVLCLLSEDDPLAPPRACMRYVDRHPKPGSKTCSSSSSVAYLLTKRGGHCGWFYGMRGISWLDEVIFEFLDASLDQTFQSKLK